MRAPKTFEVVLRISGTRLDPMKLLAARRGVRPLAVWSAGKRPSAKRAAGLSLPIATARDAGTAVRKALLALRELAPLLRGARRAGARAELDFGVYADPAAWPAVSARFAPGDLADLGRLGVELKVSSYARPR